MVMPLWYDQLVEKLAREREEGNKGMAFENPLSPIIGRAIAEMQTGMPQPQFSEIPIKKKRGRPLGSKNKPKEIK